MVDIWLVNGWEMVGLRLINGVWMVSGWLIIAEGLVYR